MALSLVLLPTLHLPLAVLLCGRHLLQAGACRSGAARRESESAPGAGRRPQRAGSASTGHASRRSCAASGRIPLLARTLPASLFFPLRKRASLAPPVRRKPFPPEVVRASQKARAASQSWLKDEAARVCVCVCVCVRVSGPCRMPAAAIYLGALQAPRASAQPSSFKYARPGHVAGLGLSHTGLPSSAFVRPPLRASSGGAPARARRAP